MDLLLRPSLVSWVFCYLFLLCHSFVVTSSSGQSGVIALFNLFLWCHGFVVSSSTGVMGLLLSLPLVSWVCYLFLSCHRFVFTCSSGVTGLLIVTSSSGVVGIMLPFPLLSGLCCKLLCLLYNNKTNSSSRFGLQPLSKEQKFTLFLHLSRLP